MTDWRDRPTIRSALVVIAMALGGLVMDLIDRMRGPR